MVDLTEYEEEFKRVEKQVQEASKRAKTYRGRCRDCKYTAGKNYTTESRMICMHPLLSDITNKHSNIIVTGAHDPEWGRINPKKGKVGRLCGRDGYLFEKRPNIFIRFIKFILGKNH